MLKKRTLFILGAGASDDFGFPLGKQLVNEIRSLCSLVKSSNGQLQPKGDIYDLLRFYVSSDRDHLREHFNAAGQLWEALNGPVFSIDNYLAAHASNQALATTTKLAIAHIISRREQKSGLMRDSGESYRQLEIPGENWISKVCSYNFLGHSNSSLEEIFERAAFISFNYDRCIQQGIAAYTAKYFKLDDAQAVKIVEKLNIVHPYGNLGDTPYLQGSAEGFGNFDLHSLVAKSARIRTFTENVSDNKMIERIRELFEWSEVVVFLGFGYIKQNLDLLWPQALTNPKRHVMGTAFGLSETNLVEVQRELAQRMANAFGFMPNDKKATEFLDDTWMTLFSQ
ncbi:MAG: hypothetical protein M3O03_01095 [Pseudomonadota bacterium]|nr:hypothetical protein [Pseudomonadota bacterium]